MRKGSLTRYVLGLAAAFAVTVAWPPAGPHHRAGPGIDGPVPAAPTTSAFATGSLQLEMGDPGDGQPGGPVHAAAPRGPRAPRAPALRTPDLSVSLALQGFLARPTRAPPVLSG